MKNYAKVPWPRVHDYLLQVGSCRTINEFMRTACAEVQKLIPFDGAAGIFSTVDGRSLYGVGLSDATNASYNEYYRTKMPGLRADREHLDHDSKFILTPVIDWREYGNLEFTTDFMMPNRLFQSLNHINPNKQVSLALQRSRLSPIFTDTEVTILDLLNLHLNNDWSLLVAGQATKNGPASQESALQSIRGKASRFGLTQREQEVALLLSERLSTPEIADRLFISRRTVEKHAANIYGKLGISGKREIRRRLFADR